MITLQTQVNTYFSKSKMPDQEGVVVVLIAIFVLTAYEHCYLDAIHVSLGVF